MVVTMRGAPAATIMLLAFALAISHVTQSTIQLSQVILPLVCPRDGYFLVLMRSTRRLTHQERAKLEKDYAGLAAAFNRRSRPLNFARFGSPTAFGGGHAAQGAELGQGSSSRSSSRPIPVVLDIQGVPADQVASVLQNLASSPAVASTLVVAVHDGRDAAVRALFREEEEQTENVASEDEGQSANIKKSRPRGKASSVPGGSNGPYRASLLRQVIYSHDNYNSANKQHWWWLQRSIWGDGSRSDDPAGADSPSSSTAAASSAERDSRREGSDDAAAGTRSSGDTSSGRKQREEFPGVPELVVYEGDILFVDLAEVAGSGGGVALPDRLYDIAHRLSGHTYGRVHSREGVGEAAMKDTEGGPCTPDLSSAGLWGYAVAPLRLTTVPIPSQSQYDVAWHTGFRQAAAYAFNRSVWRRIQSKESTVNAFPFRFQNSLHHLTQIGAIPSGFAFATPVSQGGGSTPPVAGAAVDADPLTRAAVLRMHQKFAEGGAAGGVDSSVNLAFHMRPLHIPFGVQRWWQQTGRKEYSHADAVPAAAVVEQEVRAMADAKALAATAAATAQKEVGVVVSRSPPLTLPSVARGPADIDPPQAYLEGIIVVMSYKRLDTMQRTLRGLAALPGIEYHHIILTQNIDPSREPALASWGNRSGKEAVTTEEEEASYVLRLESLLRHCLPYTPYTHTNVWNPFPPLKMAGTAGAAGATKARLYGSKRNSIRNLLNGLKEALRMVSPPHSLRRSNVEEGGGWLSSVSMAKVMVMENDVLLSPDALSFTDHVAHDVMARDPAVTFGSTMTCFRGIQPLDRPGTLGSPLWFDSNKPSHSGLRRIGSMLAMQFKTFAWMIRPTVLPKIVADFEAMVAWATPDVVHPMFDGCWYCENNCYDHYVEWVWRSAVFVAPEVPRSSQFSSGGMTEAADEVTSNPYYWGYVRPHQFHFVDSRTFAHRMGTIVVLAVCVVLPVFHLLLHPALVILLYWVQQHHAQVQKLGGRSRYGAGRVGAGAGHKGLSAAIDSVIFSPSADALARRAVRCLSSRTALARLYVAGIVLICTFGAIYAHLTPGGNTCFSYGSNLIGTWRLNLCGGDSTALDAKGLS